METLGTYQEYAQKAVRDFTARDTRERNMLVDALENVRVESVLDVGCGAGQQLLPFAEKRNAYCVGVDVAEEVVEVGPGVFAAQGLEGRGVFLQARGEDLPFEDESFDVVLCRVAIPYMDNRKALAEISRVLKKDGHFLLKTHAPMFYLGMIRRRFKTLSPKQLVYPLICLTYGTINLLTGKQPQGGLWKGKEVYQTRRFLERELKKNGLQITGELPDTNIETPSFVIKKI